MEHEELVDKIQLRVYETNAAPATSIHRDYDDLMRLVDLARIAHVNRFRDGVLGPDGVAIWLITEQIWKIVAGTRTVIRVVEVP
jgi:hypothetical protein